MAETPNLTEAIASLRHDEGCLAGIDTKYRCRCNVEELRASANAELSRIRALAELAEKLAAEYVNSSTCERFWRMAYELFP